MNATHGNEALVIIGTNIKRIRTKVGFTQGELARRVGLVRTSIVNIEAGRQDTTILRLIDIAGAMGREVGWLVEGL